MYIHVLMRDERRKEERSKQGQINNMYMYIYLGKVPALGVLCCFALSCLFV